MTKTSTMHYPSVHRAWFLFCPALIILAQSHRLVAQEADRGPQVTREWRPHGADECAGSVGGGSRTCHDGGTDGSAGDSLPDVVHLCRAARLLPAVSAAERYQLLKDWVLPSTPGALTRNAMCFAPVAFPPEVFFSAVRIPAQMAAAGRSDVCGDGRDGVINCMELLITAAAEADKLEELTTAAELAAKNCEMAQTLHLLAAFALQRAKGMTPPVDTISDRLQTEMTAPGQVRTKFWPAYLMARAWMRDDAYGGSGDRLAELLMANTQDALQRPLLSHLMRDRAVYRVRRSGGNLVAGADPGLSLWHPGGYYFASGSQAGVWPAWWVERDGLIVHVTGPEVSPLYFDYPLSGSFEFSVDGYWDTGAESAIQFGRLVFEPRGRGDKAQVLSIGDQESVKRPAPESIHGGFHRLTIRVTPERIVYLCSGVPVFDDSAPSPTTPWLALLARSTRSTAWSNLRITGDPRIPAAVPLIAGDRMEGWMSTIYREKLPRQIGQIAASDARDVADVLGTSAPADGDWSTREGVLRSRSLGALGTKLTSQSWLTYHRPLRSGDTISYEFFYQPGEKMVYPSIGRIATILEPGNVHLHWITDIPHMAMGGLRPDNAVTVLDEQRGARPLGLLPGAWNKMTIMMADDHVTLQLNGSNIYEHRLGPTDSRMFGLFHYKSRTTAEVRGLVLAGKWPDSLSAAHLAAFAARSDVPETLEQQRGRAALIDDAWLKARAESN